MWISKPWPTYDDDNMNADAADEERSVAEGRRRKVKKRKDIRETKKETINAGDDSRKSAHRKNETR